MTSCWLVMCYFVMIRRPPRSTRTDTRFPYTTLFRSLGVARLLGGDRQDLIVIDARRQIDVAGQPPDLAQGFGIVDIAALVLDHQRERQRIAEVRMILEHLHERIVLRQQVREDRLQLHIANADREERGDYREDQPSQADRKSTRLNSSH